MIRIFLVTFFVLTVTGCPPIDVPEHGEMECFDDGLQNQVCTFHCQNWTDLYGPDTITCKNGSWDYEPPVCAPNFARCEMEGAKCGELKKGDYRKMKKFRKDLSPEQQRELRGVVELLKLLPRSFGRRQQRRNCIRGLCDVRCWFLKPRKWCNICIQCKTRGWLKCSKGGQLFGR